MLYPRSTVSPAKGKALAEARLTGQGKKMSSGHGQVPLHPIVDSSEKASRGRRGAKNFQRLSARSHGQPVTAANRQHRFYEANITSLM